MEYTIYNARGEKDGTITLPEELFGVAWNADLVNQVVRAIETNARRDTAHTKTRAMVSGGGKKPWKQKGTGRARHGSTRSPIWRGGGVTFGPDTARTPTAKVNKKMRTKAFLSALSRKARDGEILFVSDMGTGEGRTRHAREALGKLLSAAGSEGGMRSSNALGVFSPAPTAEMRRALSNFGNVTLKDIQSANARDILLPRYVVIHAPAESIAALRARLNMEDKQTA